MKIIGYGSSTFKDCVWGFFKLKSAGISSSVLLPVESGADKYSKSAGRCTGIGVRLS
jgi:hypothetical protein